MRVILYTVISLLVGQLHAQTLAPGGVGEPLHWMLNEVNGTGVISWQDLQKTNPQANSPNLRFNNWGVPEWSSITSFKEFATSDKHWSSATIFMIYQTNEPQNEQALWSWEPTNRAPLLCTNQRMADLEQYQYLNHTNADHQIRLHTFYQSNKEIGGADGVFRIGQKPSAQSLPISDWQGGIAEFIFYPRVLSPQQRSQVESYLALKYGVTLAKGKDYLRSDGSVIWNAKEHKDFHHRIFGMGCDKASNWQQYHGQAAESPDCIRISLSEAPPHNGEPGPAIPDQAIWLIGDNDAPLQWEDQSENQQVLQRHWLLQTHGVAKTLGTTIQIDLGRWLTTSTDEVKYFLAIDRNGEGNFADATTELVPMSHLSLGRFGHFENIHWGADGSARYQFTIIRRGNSTLLNTHSEASLRVYPNPLSPEDHWYWQINFREATGLKTTLTNVQGQVLEEKDWRTDTYFAAEKAPLPTGVYLLNFHYGNETLTQKLIVQ